MRGLHGSCQNKGPFLGNKGPFLGTLNNRCRIILGTQKGTLILTTTHMQPSHGLLLSGP